MMKRLILIAVLVVSLAAIAQAVPVTYDGITFPDGDISFADEVVFYAPGSDVGSGFNDPTWALGPPQLSGSGVPGYTTSLGDGGILILKFTDNYLTTSGDSTADLYIFEMGNAVEWYNAAISTNGTTWIDLGDVLGQPTSIDIDSITGVVSGAQYTYVRLTDILPDQADSPYGEADIDAVGAISTAPIPLPSSIILISLGVGFVNCLGRRRTI